MNELSGVGRVGIFGAGISNKGVISFIKHSGIEAEITLRSDIPLPIETICELGADISLFGSMARSGFTEDILFLSPSVRADGISLPDSCRICSDSELFFEGFPREKTIAVTGTDGKSTTTELIARLLRQGGFRVSKIGNCGAALSGALGSDADYAVAELSSFQLMQYTPSTARAVITNITENHLDMHKSFEEYAAAKLSLAKNTEGLIYDADCELLTKELGKTKAFAVCSVYRSFYELSELVPADNYITFKDGIIYVGRTPVLNKCDLCRTEEYNIRNMMLALGATLGIVGDVAYSALCGFGGLSHRARTVFTHGGITYVDSSIDSTPRRCAETLGSIHGRCAVIICGRGKRLSYAPLLDVLYKKCVCAVLLGEAGDELFEAAATDDRYKNFKFIKCSDIKEATRAASDFVKDGTVLLSPAATSFDKYKNYEERGDDFKAAAMLISKEK